MQVKTEAKIYRKQNKSGSTSYRVDLGIVNGRRKFKTFKTEHAATEFKRKADHEIRSKHPLALSDLSRAMRYEVLSAIEKIKPYGANLGEAVDFYIKFAKPPKPSISIQEAIDEFESIKSKAGLSRRYLDSVGDYFNPLRDHFKNCLVTEIDYKQAEAYIYDHRHQWGPTTRTNHRRHAVLLFNFLTERGYISEGLNPFTKVPTPKQIENTVTPLAVAETTKLVQHTLDAGNKAECACTVLVFFCGVRVEEAEKMEWGKHVNLEKGRVEITADIAKKGKRRVNPIPANAMEWLRLCKKSKGRVAPKNYVKRMSQARKEAEITYIQNAMRHSFASYHVAAFKDAAATALQLGHPNATLLFNTYRDVVQEEDAVAYWKIRPKQQQSSEEAEFDAIKRRLNSPEFQVA